MGGTANNKHVIRAATMMVVVFTTFAFGGTTPCLLTALDIPMGKAVVEGVLAEQERTSLASRSDRNGKKPASLLERVENFLVDHDVSGYKALRDTYEHTA